MGSIIANDDEQLQEVDPYVCLSRPNFMDLLVPVRNLKGRDLTVGTYFLAGCVHRWRLDRSLYNKVSSKAADR